MWFFKFYSTHVRKKNIATRHAASGKTIIIVTTVTGHGDNGLSDLLSCRPTQNTMLYLQCRSAGHDHDDSNYIGLQWSKYVLERSLTFMPKINPPFPHINVERCLWLPKLQTCLNIEWWGKGKGKLMFSNNSQICNFIIHFSLMKLTCVMNYCILSIAFQGFISTVVWGEA